MLALVPLISVLIIPALTGIKLNYSPSLPVGLYVVTSDPKANIVEFCPTEPYASLAVSRGYRSKGSCPDGGAPLMKSIVAKQGCTVEISIRGVVVNGKTLSNSAPLKFDTAGRILQSWPFGKYRVKNGTVWVVSSFNVRSFDSRYFGPVALNSVRERLRPLLTLP
jgi:conjugative transfer signal peptidase TraF